MKVRFRQLLVACSAVVATAACAHTAVGAPAVGCQPIPGVTTDPVFVSIFDVNSAVDPPRRVGGQTCTDLGDTPKRLDSANRSADGTGYWTLAGRKRNLILTKRSNATGLPLRSVTLRGIVPPGHRFHDGMVAERFGRLWVLDQASRYPSGSYNRFIVADAETGRVSRNWRTYWNRYDQGYLTFTADAAWLVRVTGRSKFRLYRIRGDNLSSTSLAIRPSRLSEDGGRMGNIFVIHGAAHTYVINSQRSTIVRIDSATGAGVVKYPAPAIARQKFVFALSNRPAADGTIWIEADEGVAQMNLDTGQLLRTIPLKDDNVNQVAAIGNELYISSQKDFGVYRVIAVDVNTGAVRVITNLPEHHCCMPGPPILNYDFGDRSTIDPLGYFLG